MDLQTVRMEQRTLNVIVLNPQAPGSIGPVANDRMADRLGMRYLDTGGRDPDHSLYRWLAQTLPRASYFACQTQSSLSKSCFPSAASRMIFGRWT